MYTLLDKIEDFSAQSLQYIFVNHTSREAKVTTDISMSHALGLTDLKAKPQLSKI